VRIDFSDPLFDGCADVVTFASRFKCPAGTLLVVRVLAPDGSLVLQSETKAGDDWTWTSLPITIDIASVLASHGPGSYRVEWSEPVLIGVRMFRLER
jgi:hypothetical protein